jgi:hypothetical protein
MINSRYLVQRLVQSAWLSSLSLTRTLESASRVLSNLARVAVLKSKIQGQVPPPPKLTGAGEFIYTSPKVPQKISSRHTTCHTTSEVPGIVFDWDYTDGMYKFRDMRTFGSGQPFICEMAGV